MYTLPENKTLHYNQWNVKLIPLYDTSDNDYILRVEYTSNWSGGTGVIYEEPHGVHVCLDSYIPHGLHLRLERTGYAYINQLCKRYNIGTQNYYKFGKD